MISCNLFFGCILDSSVKDAVCFILFAVSTASSSLDNSSPDTWVFITQHETLVFITWTAAFITRHGTVIWHIIWVINRIRSLSGRLHVPIVDRRKCSATGLSDWSVRRSYRVNASSDRRTDGRSIKHVWFRPTVSPTVEACGHYVRLVGPTGQSDGQSRCSVCGIIIS